MKSILLVFAVGLLLIGIILGIFWWQSSPSQTPLHGLRQQTFQTPQPSPTPQRPDFATGITFPQWGTTAYSHQDANWQKGLQEIRQLHARWIAMTLPLHMAGPQSTQVQIQADTPTPQAFQEGIEQAHQDGFHIYITPFITLEGAQSWAGYISFSSETQSNAWFSSYWQVLQPYIHIMGQEHVEMLSIGNEYDRLEDENSLGWDQLIGEVRSSFSGKLIYSMNWASFVRPLPTWLQSLDTIGCSTYFSVTPTLQRLTDQQAISLWKSNVQSQLDHIAQQVGKPIYITEIGYRSGPTAGYLPYVGQRQEPQDDQEQATLYNAAMQDLSTDQNISGIFWWAWSIPPFAPNEKPATQILKHWFSYL